MGAQICNFYNFGSHFVQFLSVLLAQACSFDADKRACLNTLVTVSRRVSSRDPQWDHVLSRILSTWSTFVQHSLSYCDWRALWGLLHEPAHCLVCAYVIGTSPDVAVWCHIRPNTFNSSSKQASRVSLLSDHFYISGVFGKLQVFNEYSWIRVCVDQIGYHYPSRGCSWCSSQWDHALLTFGQSCSVGLDHRGCHGALIWGPEAINSIIPTRVQCLVEIKVGICWRQPDAAPVASDPMSFRGLRGTHFSGMTGFFDLWRFSATKWLLVTICFLTELWPKFLFLPTFVIWKFATTQAFCCGAHHPKLLWSV